MNQLNRDREKYCANKLLLHLTEAGVTAEYSAGPDPPDFIFRVNSKRWAVEHTRLVEREQGSKRIISREQCKHDDFQTAERLRTRLGNIIDGEWFLQIQGPLEKKTRSAIEDAAYKAISKNDASVLRNILFKSSPELIDKQFNDDLITLNRTSDTGSNIVCGSGIAFGSKIPGSDKPVYDISAVNEDSVNEMISIKKPKLIAIQDEYDAIVLLLDSLLWLGDHQRIHDILKQMENDLTWVDRIFLLFDGNIAQVL